MITCFETNPVAYIPWLCLVFRREFNVDANVSLWTQLQSEAKANVRHGYTLDSCSIQIGSGKKVYGKARQLLMRWEHFNLGWAFTNCPKVAVGEPVIVVAKSIGLWTINPLRINSVSEKRTTVSFSHRTVKTHQISGEEMFTLRMQKNGEVWYSIDTMSKPDTWISKMAYPILRFYQTKFKHDSMNRLKLLVEG